MRMCYRGRCHIHSKKDSLPLCTRCGIHGTNSKTGICYHVDTGCRLHVRHLNKKVAKATALDARIQDLIDASKPDALIQRPPVLPGVRNDIPDPKALGSPADEDPSPERGQTLPATA